MSSAKRTVGPWSVSEDSAGCLIVLDEDPESDLIGALICRMAEQHKSNGSAKANAEFIARACNTHDQLLLALKSIIAMCDDGVFVCVSSEDESNYDSAIEHARNAIAKAEGRK